MSQHAGLDVERWSAFDVDQQVLMIANELNRVSGAMSPDRARSRRAGYERALRLTDLTVACTDRRAFRRELLRWRGLIAELYLSAEADPDAHRSAFRALLLLRPVAARQIPLLAATREASPRGSSREPRA